MTVNIRNRVASDNASYAREIVDLSHRVCDTPELAFEEHETAAMTSEFQEKP